MTLSKIKILDKLIFYSICFFAVTLTNSIFLNQIGYFGALILAVIRTTFSQKRFEKTGMEWAFLFFIAAEALSTIFSAQPASSAIIMAKRIMLIPIIYTLLYTTEDIETVKIIFKIYLVGAVLTAVAYLVVAREHLVQNLYMLHVNGPSPFSHVMTAGGLLAMLVVILFSFAVNEKISRLHRWLITIALLIAVVALIATYTRAAWLGSAAGMIAVSMFKKKWAALAAIVFVVAGGAFLVKEKSDVYIYRISDRGVRQSDIISTKGTVYQVTPADSVVLISDYKEGILLIGKNGSRSNVHLPAPVVSCLWWRDNIYIASLIDSRLVMLYRKGPSEFVIENVFSSPGLLRSTVTANGLLYTLDKDSGVTVYRDPMRLEDIYRCPRAAGFQNMYVSERYLTLSSFDDTVSLYSLSQGIPDREIFRNHLNSPVASAFTVNKNLYIGTIQTLEHYRIDSTTVTLLEKHDSLGGIIGCATNGRTIVLAGIPGLVISSAEESAYFKVCQKIPLEYVPRKVSVNGENIYLIDRQRNRLLSVASADYPTNYQRLRMWETGLRIFQAHPLFGIGDMDVATTYAQYKQPYEKENFGHLHNNYIQFLVIFGIVGTLAVLYLLGKTLLTEIQIFRSIRQENVLSTIVLGAAGSTIAFLFNGLGEWNFGDQESMTMIWFLLGVSLAVRKFTAPKEAD
ncbi:MAG: O-antigen ligase family protein [Bacteroidota bacterium]